MTTVTPIRVTGATRPLRADPHAPLGATHAGLVPYPVAWQLQRDLVMRRAADAIGDVVLTLEHPPVFTAGKRADLAHVLWDERERARRGIAFHAVDRGGDVTYHGPGQLVGYPIIRLEGVRRVVDYVRLLERVCVAVAADLGIAARPVDGYTGVWVGREKLVAIGVRVSAGAVTSHGFAFNVTTDLEHFRGIVPCGIAERGVCSLASLGVVTTVGEVRERMLARMGEALGAGVVDATHHLPAEVSSA